MKAVQVRKAGGPEVLEMVDLAKPQLKDGWSVVKVMGFGINRSEIFTRQGLSPSVTFPRVLGIECVGTISETEENSPFTIGQKVMSLMGEMGRAHDGSYAEYVLIPNDNIYPIETELPWDLLAALPESYYTAFGALQQLQINDRDKVFVRAGSSALAIAFLKLLKSAFPKVKVYTSVRQMCKKDDLLALGYEAVFLEENGHVKTDLTFSKVLELVGPKTIMDSIGLMDEAGIICSCGQLGGQWYLEDFDPIMALQNNIYLTSFYSGNISVEKIQAMLDFMSTMKTKILKPQIFRLEDLVNAHTMLEAGSGIGKAVVLIGEAYDSIKTEV